MPFYLRFHAGPIGFSKRMGRTQAQKRAAHARARRASQRRAEKRSARQYATWLATPEGIAWTEFQARTFTAAVYDVHHRDGGTDFTVNQPGDGKPAIHAVMPRGIRPEFLTLRNGQLVRLTLSPDGTGIEYLDRA
jgi:hypothetical protein